MRSDFGPLRVDPAGTKLDGWLMLMLTPYL